MITKISILLFFFLAVIAKGQRPNLNQSPNDNDLISPCIQNKLKLSQPVQYKEFKTDERMKMFQPALRLASRLCADNFDEATAELFTKLTTPSDRSEATANLDSHTIDCYRWYLIKNQSENPIVKFLKNPEQFDDSNCDEIIKGARENYIKHTPSNKTPEDEACINKIMDRFMTQRFIAVTILHGNFDAEVVNEERKIFSNTLREITEEVVECFVVNY